MTSKRFAGGSLRIIAARSARSLRRLTARVLLVDEADAMEVTAEGNPVRLAERRTLSCNNRKIIIGSTPLSTDTSHVLRAYAESDARVFEVPCPESGGFTEILWEHIESTEKGPGEGTFFRYPHCKGLIEERHKAAMVTAGRRRATRPEVKRFFCEAGCTRCDRLYLGVDSGEDLHAQVFQLPATVHGLRVCRGHRFRIYCDVPVAGGLPAIAIFACAIRVRAAGYRSAAQ